MRRRQLLGLLAASLALGCRLERPAKLPGPTRRVIIIGAGVAGLSAANLLRAAGIEVVIVEARDRIGGRTHTLELAGARVDLGAAWIHGRRRNPVAAIADALGLATREHEYTRVRGWDAIEGREISEAELARAETRLRGLYRALARLQAQLGPTASIQAAVDLHLASLELDARAERYTRLLIEQLLIEVAYGGPSEQTSLAIFAEDEGFGDDDHLIAGGYRSLIEPLARGLDIRSSAPVVRVAHDDAGVVVETASGELLTGDRALVTVPLAVLQAGTIAFEPALPEAKRAAIARMRVGSLEKVVLRFERADWPSDPGAVWLYLAAERGEFPAIFDLSADAGAPTLVLLHGGERAAKALDERDDASLVVDALAVLEAALGRPMPPPLASHVTRWRSDPFARGSYSFPALGQTLADFDELAAPVGERLLFAGEATSRGYFGTVHGALLSAIREAARLGVDRSGLPGLG